MKSSLIKKLPYEWVIGLRYTFSGRSGRRDGFVSFISGMSVISIAVGVMALVVVLSVMNGFQKEVRDKMLAVIPHLEIISMRGPVEDWEELALDVKNRTDQFDGAAPYVRGQALLNSGANVRGTLLTGIDPKIEPQVSDVGSKVIMGSMDTLIPGSFNIVIGIDLARQLNVTTGEKISVMVPEGQFTPAGLVPRMRQFTVSGIFNSGHYDYDSGVSFININDAAALLRTGGPEGLRVKLKNMHEAPQVARLLNFSLPQGFRAADWSLQNRTWFAAVQVEKRMMGVILFLIVLVGAFGLVSSLVMTVNSKRSDIAILRTQGASQASIMKIFMIQGMFVGLVGVITGTALGLLIAFNVESIVAFVENLFGVQFLPKDIYLISSMPSDPQAGDILPIAIGSFLLSLVATVYPSWRAARIQPAEVLRYE
ncbi:MAG: lipoprotein-releasing ABC transporter permease subunit [Burkholderiales bacterium]|nr:lipoprotein-releasing ABC transporter permease subunit [Burkholderiales bacterium]